MKNSLRSVIAIAVAAQAAVLCASANAQIAWTATPTATPAPTYANTLNFDEAPLPANAGTQTPIASNAYASRGVTSITSNGGVIVNNGNVPGWTFFPAGNQATASSYIAVQFAYDITSFSAQFWESAPNSGFNGGGARIDLYDNGTVVGSHFITNPFWQGNLNVIATLPTWFNAVATGGVVFDRVEFLGFGNPFGSDTAAIDNLSWVPSPGAAALLGMGGLFAGRRRR